MIRMEKFTLEELKEGILECEKVAEPLEVIAYAQLSLARIEFNKYIDNQTEVSKED